MEYIYIAKANNNYKIGKARFYNIRLKDIRTSNPDLTLAYIFRSDNTKYVERYLHSIFLKKNVTGEWFKLSKKDIEHIKGLKIKGCKFEFVEKYKLGRKINRNIGEKAQSTNLEIYEDLLLAMNEAKFKAMKKGRKLTITEIVNTAIREYLEK